MIKVLHVLSALGGGGAERITTNYYKYMDQDKWTFDFIVHGEKIGILEEELIAKGSKIYHVTPKKKSAVKNFIEIKRAIKDSKCDIIEVHINYTSFFALIAAWICGVKVRIIHSRGYIQNDKENFKKIFFRFLNILFSTDYTACSKEAGEWLLGKELKKEVVIINNALDCEKFNFNKEVRSRVREELEIKDDEICLLQIGRFSPEKNHELSVEVLEKLNDSKYKLVFAGDGATEETIKNKVKERGLEKQVIFLGCIDNVETVMNAGDILLFPSKHEGFGNVATEAQLCGMYVLASDVIPRSTKISDNIEYMSISDCDVWVDKVKNHGINTERNTVLSEQFDIKVQAKKYENYLKGLVDRN